LTIRWYASSVVELLPVLFAFERKEIFLFFLPNPGHAETERIAGYMRQNCIY
jgi:hypothetical protein